MELAGLLPVLRVETMATKEKTCLLTTTTLSFIDFVITEENKIASNGKLI